MIQTLRNLHVQQQRSKRSFGNMHKDVEETPLLVLLIETASSEKLAVSDCQSNAQQSYLSVLNIPFFSQDLIGKYIIYETFKQLHDCKT